MAPYASEPSGAARWPAAEPPALLTAVSTEEEFDWNGPFDRAATSVSAASSLHRGQAVFDEFGVRPTYLVDYPIATQVRSREVLAELLASGRCEIGTHLHPWVSPPHEELPSPRLSFPGNLPARLERAKLEQLTAAIEGSFGVRPKVYQAGRYGFGPNTAEILEQLGYEVDLSASPAFDLSRDGGPDYSRFAPHPFWFGRERKLLAVPISGAFLGFGTRAAPSLHALTQSPLVSWTRVGGLLARIRAVERLRLSPEGCSGADLQRLSRALLERGVRVLVLSLHSPSFHPGCTPYVRSERDLEGFLATLRGFYAFFLGRLGGRAWTACELRARLLAISPPNP